jgi:hypothetical protein
MSSLTELTHADLDLESAYKTRASIFAHVELGQLDSSVLDPLFRGGKAILDEAILWDFKSQLPVLPLGVRPPDSVREAHDYKMHEIVKDAVSFYNSFGGYLVIGVHDIDRTIVGFAKVFDVASLNYKIHGATGHSVECVYRIVHSSADLQQRPLGLLFIPRRGQTSLPAQFRKDSPKNERDEYSYKAGQFYMRQRDSCRPASTPEDFEFLFDRDQRTMRSNFVTFKQRLDNNLPDREEELVKFFGREKELATLWSWLVDPFDPVKLIAGLGGLGKTSLAYTFAERFVYQCPGEFEKLIWLGAKKNYFRASTNKSIDYS